MLRTNLGLDSCEGKVLLVSSPGENEGKTTIAANLARAVALLGRRVLIIDGNLRKPYIAAAFGLAGAKGISELLTGKNEPWSHLIRADGVDILPAGAASAMSAEILSSSQMKALLKKARQSYDIVIVDSAPLMGCTDTRILAKEVDEVLLVLQSRASDTQLAKESKQVLETMGVRVTGFVLNMVGPKECKYLPYPSDKNLPALAVEESNQTTKWAVKLPMTNLFRRQASHKKD